MDRKKVINDLQYLISFGCASQQSTVQEIAREALELLKEQEPRVMTLDELTEIYVEFKGDNCQIRLINFDLQKIVMHVVDGKCRLWTGKTTYEQRKAAKWE